SILFNYIIKLLLLKKLIINIVYNSIFIIINKLIKQSIFILYKEKSTVEELGYII
ncbi:hypothetical protein M431DRAFT_102642, partial [Trichoderma harzianum CBS 226.95]